MSRFDSEPFRVEALFPNFYDETMVSYTLKSVLEGLRSETITIGATVLAKGPHVTASYVHPLVHRRLTGLIFSRLANPHRSVFRPARRRLNCGDVAYFWLSSAKDLCERFRDDGIMVVREMINCSRELKRRELRKAYAALGEADGSGITDEMIEKERQGLLMADAIFCPNRFVTASVREYGVAESSCIETSYGWGADRLGSRTRVAPDDGTFTVAFVGTFDIRKGAPLLLEAWVRSKIKGRLLLAGVVDPEVAQRFGHILRRPDVVQLGFVKDVGSVYRSADVFCFPSWEEGGPQVTFEAMSAGAVPVVTPMGTGGAFSADDDVGIVVAPGDVDALAAALCALASDRERLAHLSHRARARAADYTWERVGASRRRSLLAHRRLWIETRQAGARRVSGL
jgi:glycosyltransferase involved in cell wall biosynthesis